MVQVVSLTPKGEQLAQRLSGLFPQATLRHKPKPFQQEVRAAFQAGETLLLICATGIAVRTLGPVLRDKYTDPPVLVLDENGQFVIPLLSGHEGGANRLAAEVAEFLGAQLVMTTAESYLEPVYMVGMGCERGCPAEHLQGLLEACLQIAGITLDEVAGIHSIALKADEVGLIELAERLGKPFQTWTADALNTVDHLLSTRSDYVYKTVGVYGVAEAAALYAAGRKSAQSPRLVLEKQKTARATCAIAVSGGDKR